MMKHLVLFSICGMMLLGMPAPASADIAVSTSFRFDAASDDQTPQTSGNEFTVPFGIAYKGQKFSASLETAYSNAYVTTEDVGDSGLDGLTDTLLSVSYIHPFATRPMALMLGLDLNVPGGQENLTEKEAHAEWGQSNDLFEVDNFGDGLNVGGSLGIMRQFREGLVLAVQGAYLLNGEYDPTADVPDDTLDPGNYMLLQALLDWQARPWLRMTGVMAYSHFQEDTTEGEAHFRQGDKLAFSTNLDMKARKWRISTGFLSTFSGKSEELQDGELQPEPENSDGVNVFGILKLAYIFSPAFNARLQGDIRHYGESPLQDPDGQPFAGRRIRYAAGPGWNYRITKQLAMNGLLKLFLMQQDRDMVVDEDIVYRGLNLDIGLSYTW